MMKNKGKFCTYEYRATKMQDDEALSWLYIMLIHVQIVMSKQRFHDSGDK